MSAGQLNVVIHGLFAIVYHDECIEAIAPVVEDGHGQRARCQNTEYTFQLGHSYMLRGVRSVGSVTRFSKTETPVVEKFRVINRATNVLFCSIYLPFPQRVSTLRAVPGRATDFFQGETRKQIVSKGVPFVHVLTYEFGDHLNPRLLGTTWNEGGNAIGEGDEAVNLHLSCERRDPPTQALARAYAIHSFPRLTRLFPGMDLELCKSGWVRPADSDIGDLGEQRTLYERARAQQIIGNQNIDENETESSRTTCFSLIVDNT
jgi:hypothetical protein